MLSNSHNLVTPPQTDDKRFGVRASLPASDPFRHLLDANWETFYWYAGAAERDAAMTDMRKRHRYSRMGDAPTVRYEPVNR